MFPPERILLEVLSSTATFQGRFYANYCYLKLCSFKVCYILKSISCSNTFGFNSGHCWGRGWGVCFWSKANGTTAHTNVYSVESVSSSVDGHPLRYFTFDAIWRKYHHSLSSKISRVRGWWMLSNDRYWTGDQNTKQNKIHTANWYL